MFLCSLAFAFARRWSSTKREGLRASQVWVGADCTAAATNEQPLTPAKRAASSEVSVQSTKRQALTDSPSSAALVAGGSGEVCDANAEDIEAILDFAEEGAAQVGEEPLLGLPPLSPFLRSRREVTRLSLWSVCTAAGAASPTAASFVERGSCCAVFRAKPPTTARRRHCEEAGEARTRTLRGRARGRRFRE